MLVGDRAATSLRWANNSMTTNGVSTARNTTVISIVRQGDTARVGTLTSAEVDPSAIEELVAASQAAAATAPEARDAAPLLSDDTAPADWDAPIPGTGPEVFSRPHRSTGSRIPAAPTRCTASRNMRWRRRFWRRRADYGAATPNRPVRWRSTPNATAPAPGRASEPRLRRCADGFTARAAVDATGLGQAPRRVAGRALRDDPAAVDSRRHDDLPGVVDERPRRARGPHRAQRRRRRNPGRGEADRSAADAVLRSHGVRAGLHTVRRDVELVGDVVDLRQRA